MPASHELQLMLVNTLRKVDQDFLIAPPRLTCTQDLDHESVARICLALDVIITAPTEDLVPAVQQRLHDILSHNSSVCDLRPVGLLVVDLFLTWP